MYLRTLRLRKNISIKTVAEHLQLSHSTIHEIEDGKRPPPKPGPRLKLWLGVLGESGRYKQLCGLLNCVKKSRTIRYRKRDLANEHIDRLIDLYESDDLSPLDLELLRMIGPQAYDVKDPRPSSINRD